MYGERYSEESNTFFFKFVLDKMGKKHHIGGAARILTFLVVVSIFLFHFFLIDAAFQNLFMIPYSFFFIFKNCQLKGNI